MVKRRRERSERGLGLTTTKLTPSLIHTTIMEYQRQVSMIKKVRIQSTLVRQYHNNQTYAVDIAYRLEEMVESASIWGPMLHLHSSSSRSFIRSIPSDSLHSLLRMR